MAGCSQQRWWTECSTPLLRQTTSLKRHQRVWRLPGRNYANNVRSSVRKASVFFLEFLHQLVGELMLQPSLLYPWILMGYISTMARVLQPMTVVPPRRLVPKPQVRHNQNGYLRLKNLCFTGDFWLLARPCWVQAWWVSGPCPGYHGHTQG